MKWLIANWKMHGSPAMAAAWRQQVAAHLAAKSGAARAVVCPPFPLLHVFGGEGVWRSEATTRPIEGRSLRGAKDAEHLSANQILLGAQNCHSEAQGAFTGEISAAMLKDAGCSHVILGHSERRAQAGETSAQVREKLEAALVAGLTPVLCVGEILAEREAGQAEHTVITQLFASLPDSLSTATLGQLMVAYEPVWAIGTGLTPTLADITAMHGALRTALTGRFGAAAAAVPLLYGGSVKPANIADILRCAGVDGVLIGGASLSPDDFCAMLDSAQHM